MKMKLFTSMMALSCVMILFSSTQAQSLKRLKQRVENKVENRVNRKIDQKIDKVLDRAFEGNPDKDRDPSPNEEEQPQRTANRNKNFGTANISHPAHPTLNVKEMGQTKVIRKGSYHKIIGSWWTHEADIFDGFVIEIFDAKTIKSDDAPEKITFNIPSEASLKLGYDPSLPVYQEAVNNMKRAVTDDYQEYSLPSGQVTISILNEGQIKFSYDGPGGMSGKVEGSSPTFMEEDDVKKKERVTSSGGIFGNNSMSRNSGNSPDPASEYTFTTEVVNKITMKGEKESYEMSFFINPDESYVGMGADMGKFSQGDVQGESIIVMDNGNAFIFVNSSGMKLLMSSMPGQEEMTNDQMADYDYSNIRKTGASKKIMGYTCYEYEMKDEQTQMNLWASPDFDLPNWFVQQSGTVNSPIEGFIMEYHIDSPDGNMTSTTIDIKRNINKKIISAGYRKF